VRHQTSSTDYSIYTTNSDCICKPHVAATTTNVAAMMSDVYIMQFRVDLRY